MNNLNNLLHGLHIGDRATEAFIELTRKKTIGVGLFDYTTWNGYRGFNTSNNFPRTASYYNIKRELDMTSIPLMRFFNGGLEPAYNVDGLEVGWAYTTDINKTRFKRGYVSSADFNEFQMLLRNRALNSPIATYDINKTIENYGDKNQSEKNSFLVTGGLGEYIILGDNKITPHAELKDYYSGDKKSLLQQTSTLFYKKGPKSYAVEDSSLGEYYKVELQEQTQQQESEIKITKYKGGELTSFNPSVSVRTHSFFEEPGRNTDYNSENDSLLVGYNEVFINIPENTNTSRMLDMTNKLFKSGKIKSLINRFHTDKEDLDNEFITAKTNEYGLSRGRNLLKDNHANNKNGLYENPYCRVWTAHHQYASLRDRIRPFLSSDGRPIGIGDFSEKLPQEMRPNNAAKRLGEHSVLQSNGFVRITPQNNGGSFDNIKNYMFSIENLAWKDNNSALSPEQLGPNKGRIMWFPPYNLKFSENINVNWNGNSFIGRGEQIYTYVNTERSGTLDFSILIDHPSIINEWSYGLGNLGGVDLEEKKQSLLRFFAGCGDLDINKNSDTTKENDQKQEGNSSDGELSSKEIKIAYVLFFPNNYSGHDDINDIDKAMISLNSYEQSTGGNWESGGNQVDSQHSGEILEPWNKKNKNELSLNQGGKDTEEYLKEYLKKYLNSEDITFKYFKDMASVEEGKVTYKINNVDSGDTIFGYDKKCIKFKNIQYHGTASSHGYASKNILLAEHRKNLIRKIMTTHATFISDIDEIEPQINPNIETNDKGKKDINTKDAKLGRMALAVITLELRNDITPINTSSENGTIVNGAKIDNTPETKREPIKEAKEEKSIALTDLKPSYDNEARYFTEISKDDSMVKHLVNKVKYFDPAFHSITPEGFNARLTFLQQCTRQGPTNSVSGGGVNKNSSDFLKMASNLAFGRAPYCILRIGDFFNTKICIDSMSISYDNDNGPLWDLNQEGAGVQPMMANVSINFKFIGGQDLSGPIERLQNAVSSNYYANASVYDKNARYNEKIKK